MSRVVVPLADGFEEIEAVTVIDILRRAGAEVIVVSLDGRPATSSHGVTIVPDASIDEVDPSATDLVVLPGGLPGAHHLRDDARVRDLVRTVLDRGKRAAAICAAPATLAAWGVFDGHRATGHPSVMGKLRGAVESEDRVVRDGNLITSRSPGTALEFAFALVEALYGHAKVEELNRGVLAKL
ncbi:MAG: DJ-1/PfpI family protein [Planctomycetes bacterium]|nr:DJ-1/PfpI family protein [Planctomycetota bacterium]